MYKNYSDMPRALETKQTFRGNSVNAFIDADQCYTVYSYNTIIYQDGNGSEPFFNNAYFSVTTSRLQNMLIRALGLNDGVCKRD